MTNYVGISGIQKILEEEHGITGLSYNRVYYLRKDFPKEDALVDGRTYGWRSGTLSRFFSSKKGQEFLAKLRS